MHPGLARLNHSYPSLGFESERQDLWRCDQGSLGLPEPGTGPQWNFRKLMGYCESISRHFRIAEVTAISGFVTGVTEAVVQLRTGHHGGHTLSLMTRIFQGD